MCTWIIATTTTLWHKIVVFILSIPTFIKNEGFTKVNGTPFFRFLFYLGVKSRTCADAGQEIIISGRGPDFIFFGCQRVLRSAKLRVKLIMGGLRNVQLIMPTPELARWGQLLHEITASWLLFFGSFCTRWLNPAIVWKILSAFVRLLFAVAKCPRSWRKLSIIRNSFWIGLRILMKEKKDVRITKGRSVLRFSSRSNSLAVNGIFVLIFTGTCMVCWDFCRSLKESALGGSISVGDGEAGWERSQELTFDKIKRGCKRVLRWIHVDDLVVKGFCSVTQCVAGKDWYLYWRPGTLLTIGGRRDIYPRSRLRDKRVSEVDWLGSCTYFLASNYATRPSMIRMPVFIRAAAPKRWWRVRRPEPSAQYFTNPEN